MIHDFPHFQDTNFQDTNIQDTNPKDNKTLRRDAVWQGGSITIMHESPETRMIRTGWGWPSRRARRHALLLLNNRNRLRTASAALDEKKKKKKEKKIKTRQSSVGVQRSPTRCPAVPL